MEGARLAALLNFIAAPGKPLRKQPYRHKETRATSLGTCQRKAFRGL